MATLTPDEKDLFKLLLDNDISLIGKKTIISKYKDLKDKNTELRRLIKAYATEDENGNKKIDIESIVLENIELKQRIEEGD